MDSTASDDHGLRPSSAAAPASAFLDGHPLFLPSSSSTCLDDQAAGSFHLPSSPFLDTNAQDPLAPPSSLASPPSAAAAARKPPRKRPRASRRPPTTVLTTDTSNFRAMVQEFTGFPAPPPFAVPAHLRPGGALFGAGPSDNAATLPSFPLLRQSHLRLPASRASPSPPNCTTSNTTGSLVLDALAAFAKTKAIAPPAAAAAPPSSGSEFNRSWPFDDGFPVAEGERAGPDHGFFSYRH